ncbi:MAG: AAA family ATPase [Magnetococcales bacterium]|nr:AAA family ATPase [Magnetococcales bacterium]
MIESISVENFKNLTKLELSGLSRLVLIGGKNNCGKSSLLEAMAIAIDPENKNLLKQSLRNLDILNHPAPLSTLFYNYAHDNTIKISTNNNAYYTTLEFSRDSRIVSSIFSTSVSSQHIKRYGQKEEQRIYNCPQTKQEVADCSSSDECRIGPVMVNPYKDGFFRNAILLTTVNTKISEFVNLYSKIYHKPHSKMLAIKRKISELGKILDPTFAELSITSFDGTSYFYVITTENSFPISSYGEGLQRFMAIILHMIHLEGGVLLIDEIENGLHHSVLVQLWQGISAAAREMNCQVIASTHSYECIQAAYQGCSEHPDDLTFVRLDRNSNGTIKPAVFNYEALEVALKHDWEIR